ncbi:MAG: T9SS type B sorting domain-containing protein [Flavobacteriaceae bacterium]
MKTSPDLKIIVVLSFLAFTVQNSYAQLSFCSGNSGDPIFTEDFGTGNSSGPALATGTTTYSFTSGTPSDGSYTISSSTNYFNWHNTADHTPNDTDGKSFIVNASYNAGEFYRRTVSGLCENTSYEFSSWLVNLLPNSSCGGAGIPVSVKFQIWDSTDTNLLASGDTGSIANTATVIWKQYALVFQTLPGQTAVILKMINNSDGGCGNDLAIDDIVFKSCGDFIFLTNDPGENIIAQCENEGVIISTTIMATADFSIYNSHAYQWQESSDSVNWVDILGETNNTYTTPTLANSRFFRVKVAEDALNVSNDLCNVVSDIFSAIIVPIADPPLSNGDVFTCANVLNPLTVSVPSDQVVNWYNAPTGGSLLLENSTSYTPSISATFYAAASSNLVDCFSLTRTPLTYTIYELPVVSDENLFLCENVALILTAGVTDVTYLWNTGETTENIEIIKPGVYTMSATNSNGCSVTKTMNLEQIDEPIIDTIISNNEDIIVSTVNSDEFEYAINNGFFQDSPVFELVEGGLHIIKVRGKNNCPEVRQEFIHFVVPKFFSPNGDTFNDVFLLQGLEFFTSVDVQIFDRYGMLIKQSSTTSFTWDGTFNGKTLPSSDYWYSIWADNQQFTGHFALKR